MVSYFRAQRADFIQQFLFRKAFAWSTRPGPLRCCNDTVRHIHRSIYDDRCAGNCRQRGLRIIIIAHIILYPQQSIGKQPSSLGSNHGNLSPAAVRDSNTFHRSKLRALPGIEPYRLENNKEIVLIAQRNLSISSGSVWFFATCVFLPSLGKVPE